MTEGVQEIVVNSQKRIVIVKVSILSTARSLPYCYMLQRIHIDLFRLH